MAEVFRSSGIQAHNDFVDIAKEKLSVAIHVHPLLLMVPAAMAANCAYMLPVGTPPNAIVFGTGKITIKKMATVGFWVNMVSVLIIVLVVYFLVPPVLGIDITQPLKLK
jgi:sodium-dependent dicarboxylate transporter 2/3/5